MLFVRNVEGGYLVFNSLNEFTLIDAWNIFESLYCSEHKHLV